jgi:hypothetical protein
VVRGLAQRHVYCGSDTREGRWLFDSVRGLAFVESRNGITSGIATLFVSSWGSCIRVDSYGLHLVARYCKGDVVLLGVENRQGPCIVVTLSERIGDPSERFLLRDCLDLARFSWSIIGRSPRASCGQSFKIEVKPDLAGSHSRWASLHELHDLSVLAGSRSPGRLRATGQERESLSHI